MPKINEKKLERIQADLRGWKTLYEASAIAQEKQIFPKNASQAVKTDVTPSFEIKAENYSSLNRVLRKTANANRFIKKFEENQHTSRNAYSQRKWNGKYCMYTVLAKKTLHRPVKGWDGQLNLKIENDGLIRCYDQLNNTDLPEETMNPVLLPTMEKVFELLIEYHHEKMFHVEVNHTPVQVRIKYWILQGQAEIRSFEEMQCLSEVSWRSF